MDIINSKLLIEKSLEFNENQEEETKESLKFQFEQTDNLNETIKAKRRECKSTSDDSFEFDFSKSSLIFENSLLNRNFIDDKNINYLTNGGKFGFNPSYKTSTSSSTSPTSLTLSPLGFGKMKTSRERRHRRLTTTTNSLMNDSKKHNSKNKLIHAVSLNDYNTVLELLKAANVDINCCDDKQRTCLHIASAKGNIEIVRILLDFGANPNIRDCVHNLPIHLAIISSHVPVVTLLLEAGTDIHSLDIQGKTVLHLAGTRLRWLLNDDNNKASAKLKLEAIQIMNMIKEYLKRKDQSIVDLDLLSNKFENVFSLDDINTLTNELLNKFNSIDIKSS